MTEPRQFSESELHKSQRYAINRLRKFYPEDIIFACILKLNEHKSDTIKHISRYPPWRLLLLIKWTLIYGDFSHPKRRHLSVDDNNFNDLINRMHILEDHSRTLEKIDDVFFYFRTQAFRQFWLQHQLNINSLARQSILFGNLDISHPFQKDFLRKTGISIPHFIELSLMLMPRFVVEKQKSVNLSWFANVANKYPRGTVERFLTLLSSDVHSLRKKLSEPEFRSRNLFFEIHEKTPLRKTPLIKINSEYFTFSANLLARSLETFIYDTLRTDDPSVFMNTFGPLFEKYVEFSIAQTRIEFLAEKDLKKHLQNTKIVDFLIVDNESNIFIDAKGVEMSYLGMVGDQPGIIENNTRDSIIRGIRQGFETAQRLQELDTINGIKLGHEKNYLLIVTFKDMYVGNGSDFYQFIAKETLDTLISEYHGVIPIPFENMYFMSINDFDGLTGGINIGTIELANTLERAVAADKEAASKKLEFSQHLNEFFPDLQYPKWLEDENRLILSRCKERFIT